MRGDEAPASESPRLIRCVLPKGRAAELIERLHATLAVETGSVTSGRSRGMVLSISYGEWQEVDILSVLAMADAAEDVFAFLYREADIDQPGGGLMYMARLNAMTAFLLPDIADEGGAATSSAAGIPSSDNGP